MLEKIWVRILARRDILIVKESFNLLSQINTLNTIAQHCKSASSTLFVISKNVHRIRRYRHTEESSQHFGLNVFRVEKSRQRIFPHLASQGLICLKGWGNFLPEGDWGKTKVADPSVLLQRGKKQEILTKIS